MGRLIDADLLKKNCKCTGKFEDNFKCVDLIELSKVIDAQPTAYDVENVVAELEEKQGLFVKIECHCKDCVHWFDGVAGATEHVKLCTIGTYMTGKNGYCLYAEKKVNEHERDII